MKLLQYIFLGIVFTLLSFSSLFAQKGVEDGSKYGHGEDSIRCIRNLSLSREYSKNDNFKDAYKYWKIIYSECPSASKNIYIDGVDIFKYLIENEENPQRKDEMIDTLMQIYDRRIEYFKQKGSVLSRKGIDLLRYRRDDVNSIKEAYGYLNESIELLKAKSSEATLATLFTSSVTLYKAGEFTEEDVIKDYARVTEIIDKNIADNDPKAIKVKESVDQNFITSGAATCEALINLYSPKFESTPDDVELLKNIIKFLDNSKCTDSDLFFQASANLHKQEPSSLSASSLAIMAMGKEEYEVAYDYFTQAIEMETDNERKAEYHYSLGIIGNKLKKLSDARQHALEAAKLKPGWGEPYILIGNLYANSLNICSDLDLPKAVFWVAVDKFYKAKQVDPSVADKANDLIKTYSEYFPNKEEAFFYNIIDGSSYTVGCWINETTNVRF